MPRYRRYRRRFPWRLGRTRRIPIRRNPKNKYSPRRWRRHLLSDTHAATHYRSLWSVRTTVSAPADPVNLTYIVVNGIPPPTTQPFWTTPAAKPVDTGNPVPGFGRNVVIRGGRISLSICFAAPVAATESCKVRIWLVWRKHCTDNAILPATGTESWTWDPSVQADFTRYGRIVRSWQAIVEPTTGSNSVQVFHRLQPQKIDTEVFEQQGAQFVWVVAVHKISFAAAVVQAFTVNAAHSLSFSGDEIS